MFRSLEKIRFKYLASSRAKWVYLNLDHRFFWNWRIFVTFMIDLTVHEKLIRVYDEAQEKFWFGSIALRREYKQN